MSNGIDSRVIEYSLMFSPDVRMEFVLLNFPGGDGSWDAALSWGKQKGYLPTNVEEVMLIGEQGDFTKVTGIGQDAMSSLYATATFAGHILNCDHPDIHEGLPSAGGFDATKHYSVWFLFHKS